MARSTEVDRVGRLGATASVAIAPNRIPGRKLAPGQVVAARAVPDGPGPQQRRPA